MILEGLVTTCDVEGRPHLAPMGPIVSPDMRQLVLRPFQTSQTFAHLARSGQGVLHVTDDVELIARAAVDRLESLPAMTKADAVEGWILSDACRWYAFRIVASDTSRPRAEMTADVVAHGELRPFFGFNRAKHAVIELAIVATRIHLLPAAEIAAEFERWQPIVHKTGGAAEQRAYDFLGEYVAAALERENDKRDVHPCVEQPR